MWGGDFLVNYYHKGVIVHTQQVTQGSAIGSLPELNLESCDDEINLFVGWIAETDVANYQEANNTTPTFITEDYVPTANTNLYALFADGEAVGTSKWSLVTKISQLRDGDKIIIAAAANNYAMGKILENNRFNAVKITKSEDKTVIYPTDEVQKLTINLTDQDNTFTLFNGSEYLCNKSKDNNTIGTTSTLDDKCNWQFTIMSSNLYILNLYTANAEYLYFNLNSYYFACSTSQKNNLSIYKQTEEIINYLTCTTPEAVEYTITLHDGNNVSEIKCMSNASIPQPEATQAVGLWKFYGWATTPMVDNSEIAPEIITFPYTPAGNIDLYAVYSVTTSEGLVMQNKTVPSNWEVDETLSSNSSLSMFANDYIEIPYMQDIVQIDIEMQARNFGTTKDQYLGITTDDDERFFMSSKLTNTLKTYSFSFDEPYSTSLKISSFSNSNTVGVLIRSIVVHRQPVYSTSPQVLEYKTISFDVNGGKDTIKTYSIKQVKGGEVVLPVNVYTCSDKAFMEWNSMSDGSGSGFVDGAVIAEVEDDMELYAQWGTELVVAEQECVSVDTSITVDRLVIKSDCLGATGELYVAEEANLEVLKSIIVEKNIDNLRYHFFSLPFDCAIADVMMKSKDGNILTYASTATDGDWVICRYDQILAANNAGDIDKNAWVEILDREYLLKANQGYIVGYFGEEENVVVRFISKESQTITAPETKVYDLGGDYAWYTEGVNLSSNGWNLIGQPYYETLRQGDLINFVTIPNSDGKTYRQCTYREALAEGLLTPFSAFFVQLKENEAPMIRVEELDYAQYNGEESDFMQIYLSDGEDSDRTTIIANSKCTSEYEIGSDLKKWVGYAEKPQIYTIEKDLALAFNAQNITESTLLSLGVYVPVAGDYTFSVNENCGDLYLVDKEKGVIVNLSQSDYTVDLSEGKFDNRFEVSFQKMTATHLTDDTKKIEYFVKNGSVFIKNVPQNGVLYVHDCTGKLIYKTKTSSFNLPFRGVYHIIIKIGEKNHDCFNVIY